jgi:cobalamin biosynthesis Mg chelatase CobN
MLGADKLSQAGHYVKESAVAGKLSDAAHRLSNSAAGQKISQTGEYVKDKVAAGTASIQHAATTVKDKAEATAIQAKEKATNAAHSAHESAHQASERVKDSAMGQKISQTAQDVKESETAQKLSQTARDAKDKIAAKVTPDPTLRADVAAKHEEFRGPYSAMWGPISSLFTGTIRSFFMFHWLKVLLVHSTFGVLAMATAFFIGSQFCSFHHYIWEGRPLKLMLLDQGFELTLSVTTALIVYHFGVAK